MRKKNDGFNKRKIEYVNIPEEIKNKSNKELLMNIFEVLCINSSWDQFSENASLGYDISNRKEYFLMYHPYDFYLDKNKFFEVKWGNLVVFKEKLNEDEYEILKEIFIKYMNIHWEIYEKKNIDRFRKWLLETKLNIKFPKLLNC